MNQAVAITYPKLRAKFGPIVLYAQDKTAHIRTEFGFDMAQVAKQRYAPQQYHDFIGFKVSKELLERVFPVVYGVQLKDVLPHEDLAIGSFRYSVSSLIPHMTQVALRTHKKEIMSEVPNFQKQKFLYRLSRADYEKQWGKEYQRAGFGVRFLAVILKVLPKVGPLKALDFNIPTPKTENLYFTSINLTVDKYGLLLKEREPDRSSLPTMTSTAASRRLLASTRWPMTPMPSCFRNWLTRSSMRQPLRCRRTFSPSTPMPPPRSTPRRIRGSGRRCRRTSKR